MKKGRHLLLIFGGVAAACLLTVVFWPTAAEPRYNGENLSHWVLRLDSATPSEEEMQRRAKAQKAILAVGTNAVPWLLKWIAYEPGSFKRNTYRFLKDIHIDSPYRTFRRLEARSDNSVLAFRCLGPAAEPAIPELNRIMTNSGPWRNPCDRARDSLAFTGESAVPWLLTALTNRCRYRYELPDTFAFMGRQGTDVRPAIPILIELLKDPDQATAERCAHALAQLERAGIEPDTIRAALFQATHDARPGMRRAAVVALADLRDSSKTKVSALISSMDDPDSEVASYAIRMLARQQSHADLVIPAILQRLKPNDVLRVRTQIDALAHFGPRARAAVPALLQIMERPASPSVEVAASNAVWRIERKALQK